jgi:hypothetical protein
MNIEARIRQGAMKRDQLTRQLTSVNAELEDLVREAFHRHHLPAARISKAFGRSRERCYQIRDGRS